MESLSISRRDISRSGYEERRGSAKRATIVTFVVAKVVVVL